MVGLLIVSHSSKIAEGVKDLADQMTKGEVPIAIAGGANDGSLGTSADLIRQALEQLASADGILVLLDLGSAVLSAETALEEFNRPYLISDAPLVEGAVMAAIEASVGADLAQTATAADQARELRKIQG